MPVDGVSCDDGFALHHLEGEALGVVPPVGVHQAHHGTRDNNETGEHY